MEGRRADVTAFQLAAELASSTATPAFAPPQLNTASENKGSNNINYSGSDCFSHQQYKRDDTGNADSTKRRGHRVSRLNRLLDEQQHFALRDNAAPVQSNGNSNVSHVPPATATTAATKKALQEAMLRWGLMKNEQGVLYPGMCSSSESNPGRRFGMREDPSAASLPSASSFLHHSWRLVEATRQPSPNTNAALTAAATSTTSELAPTASFLSETQWSLGQRWERSDNLIQANALLKAVQGEIAQHRHVRVAGNGTESSRTILNTESSSFYLEGLRLCAESVRSAASLPATLSAAVTSASPSLQLFTFTEEEYNALTPPPPQQSPLLLPPSTFTFTYASSCCLFELWAKFGNAVVVRDRWAWEVKRALGTPSFSPLAHKFNSMSTTENNTAVTDITDKQQAENGADYPEASIPSVEELCAEYYRVTTGVLQQRQQRLFQAVLAQQHRLQQQQQSTIRASAKTTASAFENNGKASRQSNTSDAEVFTSSSAVETSSKTHAPFVASFDRYALLHSVKVDTENEEGMQTASNRTEQQQLASPPQPSPPPKDFQASTRTTAVEAEGATAVSAADGSAGPSLGVSPLPMGLINVSDLTPQQRLTKYTTPHPWYRYSAELLRRAAVAELLRCEGATNVPYQHAASRYLALVTNAAQALQRASFVFDDRDREEQAEREYELAAAEHEHRANVKKGDGFLCCAPQDGLLSEPMKPMPEAAPMKTMAAPPRSAFTVRLQPLPNIDPAAWKTAEAALRKAAAEVLGTNAATLLNFSTATKKEQKPSRSGGKRPRSRLSGVRAAGASRKAIKQAKRREKESIRGQRAAAASSAAKNQKTMLIGEDEDESADEADDNHGESSSESSLASSNESGDVPEANESVASKSDNDSDLENNYENEEDDDEDDEDAAPHLSKEKTDTYDNMDVGNENGDASTEVSSGRRTKSPHQSKQRGRPLRQIYPQSTSKQLSLPSTSQQSLQFSNLPADTTYRALQEYIADAIPFRCTRLRVATQAGWLLPPPPALPHSLTEPLDESEVVLVDVEGSIRRGAAVSKHDATHRGPTADEAATDNNKGLDISSNVGAPNETAARPSSNTDSREACDVVKDTSLYDPILNEEDYQELRKVSTSTVCNRVVSHTGEAVLLSLPPTLPRLHREVEQELERYLYDDASAMMEVNATAQSLIAQIRVAYTQNTYLQRYTARLEHVVENLKKVVQECRDAAKPGTDLATS